MREFRVKKCLGQGGTGLLLSAKGDRRDIAGTEHMEQYMYVCVPWQLILYGAYPSRPKERSCLSRTLTCSTILILC